MRLMPSKPTGRKVVDDIPKDAGFEEVTRLCDLALEHNIGILKAVDNLQSAQAEIIRCGECKHRDPEDHKCDCGHFILWQLPRDDKWYCADAERKDE